MFRRRIHSFLTRFVLVCLHEIVSIGKQRRSQWPGTINQAQPIVPSKCGYSIPSRERHAAAWFAPGKAGEPLRPLRHRRSTNQRDVVVCWAFGSGKRLPPWAPAKGWFLGNQVDRV